MGFLDIFKKKKIDNVNQIADSENSNTDYKPVSDSGFTTMPKKVNVYRNDNFYVNLPKFKNDRLILDFDIYQIHHNEKEFVFFLFNTSDVNDNNNLIIIQISIPLVINENGSIEFDKKIVLGQGINKFDRAGLNFGRFLNEKLNWNTDKTYLRSLRLTINNSQSVNLVPNKVLTDKIAIKVTDATLQDIFELEIDWQQKKSSIIISKSNIETFKSIFFVPTEVTNQLSLEPEIIKNEKIKNFDKDGEPELTLMSNGQLNIHFNFMPPLNGNDEQSALPIFDTFDKELSGIVGKEVIWEDRELFIIQNSSVRDFNKIKKYLEKFWIEK